MNKRCNACKLHKEEVEFNKACTRCKACRKEDTKKYRNKHNERIKQKRKEYNKLNKEKIESRNKKWYNNNNVYMRSKNLRIDIEICQEFVNSYSGFCEICKKPTQRFDLDHDHQTGKIRGCLCRQCNLCIGAFKDNTDVMEKAISYLLYSNIELKSQQYIPPQNNLCLRCGLIKENNNFPRRFNFCKSCVYYKKEKIIPDQILRDYKITEMEYINILKLCNKSCMICQTSDIRLCLDHCHKTGIVRGLLCNHCNGGLGQCYDNIQIIENSIQYLRKHSQ